MVNGTVLDNFEEIAELLDKINSKPIDTKSNGSKHIGNTFFVVKLRKQFVRKAYRLFLVRNGSELLYLKNEIIILCELYNLSAYVNIERKSYAVCKKHLATQFVKQDIDKYRVEERYSSPVDSDCWHFIETTPSLRGDNKYVIKCYQKEKTPNVIELITKLGGEILYINEDYLSYTSIVVSNFKIERVVWAERSLEYRKNPFITLYNGNIQTKPEAIDPLADDFVAPDHERDEE